MFPSSIWNGLQNQVAFGICFKYGASCFFGQMDDLADLWWCAQLFPTWIWNGLLNQVAFWICLKDGANCFLGKWMIPLTSDDVPNCSLVQFGMDCWTRWPSGFAWKMVQVAFGLGSILSRIVHGRNLKSSSMAWWFESLRDQLFCSFFIFLSKLLLGWGMLWGGPSVL